MGKEKKSEITKHQRVLTPEFRVFFPHVFKPQAMKGSEPKYSVTMAFKKDKADLSGLKLAIKHAKIEEFGPNKSSWPDDLESPVVDGDDEKYADKPEYAGHWVIKASCSPEFSKPGVVDYPDADDIINPADFYPGCYARAQVFARVWEFGNKQGVHFILDHVQKLRDGKPIGGKKDAKSVFNPHGGQKKKTDIDDGSGIDDEQDFT